MATPAPLVAAGEFVLHPRKVGSPFQATQRMVQHLFRPLDWDAIDTLVEYGPGTGRFTFEALGRMKPSAKLLAIEPGERFVTSLRDRNADPRLEVIQGSAEDVRHHLAARGLSQADCVLTGLPFSTLPDAIAERIVAETAAMLAPTGTLAAYQMRRAIAPRLARHFHSVEHGYEWCNAPPCHLYWASGLRGAH